MGFPFCKKEMYFSHFKQLFELEDISPVLHRQRMEVDSIRLIEEKQQEN